MRAEELAYENDVADWMLTHVVDTLEEATTAKTGAQAQAAFLMAQAAGTMLPSEGWLEKFKQGPKRAWSGMLEVACHSECEELVKRLKTRRRGGFSPAGWLRHLESA